MKRKETVFGSKVERTAFASVQSQWSDRFNIHLSLPFSNIIDFFDDSLSEKERDTLLKTSVDFTLANKQKDKPILSVEFDGIGCGFNKDGVYVPKQSFEEIDPYRKLKLDLKLRACKAAGYPLIVVSYDEIANISQDEQITVLDGIIGQILSRLWLASPAGNTRARELRDFAETLPSPGREEALEFIGIDAEFFTKIQWNPVFKRAAELLEDVLRQGLCNKWATQYLSHPRYGPNAPENVGITFSATTPNGDRSTTIWLRNVNAFGIDVTELAEMIGRIRIFSSLLTTGQSS